MSVQQEHLSMSQASQEERTTPEAQTEQPPKLEYSAQNADESLAAYGAAIGGAVLGVLLTLLVLAVINGGTLRFTNQSSIASLQNGLTRVDENVGAVNHNVEVVAQQLEALQGETGVLTQIQGNLNEVNSTLSDQNIHLSELDDAVATLDVTRKNFDVFTSALAQALAEMGVETTAQPTPAAGETGAAAPSEAPAAATPEAATGTTAQENSAAPAATAEGTASAEAVATSEATAQASSAESTTAAEGSTAGSDTAAVAPSVVSSSDVAADAVLVYFFNDANHNGVMDEDEASLVGLTVALNGVDSTESTTAETGDSGALFENLAAGEYTVAVEDSLGYNVAGDGEVNVTVPEAGEEGQIVYFPVEESSSQ